MGHVCGCGEKFGEYITGVAGRLYSPDLNMSLNVVLADSMMTDVDAPTMFVHSGLCGDVFRSLVICEEVSRFLLLYCRRIAVLSS
jgi:hypothetical protein